MNLDEFTTANMLQGFSIQKAQNKTDFFRLPRELRDGIYTYVLGAKYREIERSQSDILRRIKREPETSSANLSILRVCHRIAEEAIPLLYRENTFRLAVDPQRSSLQYSKTIDGIQNVRATLCLDSRRSLLLAHSQLVELCLTRVPKKSCHIELMTRRWLRPRLMALEIRIMIAASLVFQEVTIEVPKARYNHFPMSQYDGLTLIQETNRRKSILKNLQDNLRKTLGEYTVENTTDSELLVFQPRTKAEVEAYIKENPGKDVTTRLFDPSLCVPARSRME